MVDINRFREETTLQKKTLHAIYQYGPITRGELSEILDVSLISISKFVGALMTDGIVVECGSLESTGGRKTNLLGINAEYAYILGVDIGGYAAKLGVVRMDGTIAEEWFIRSTKENAPVKSVNPRTLSDFIKRIFEKYDKNKFMAICVGISGMVNHETGRTVFCPNFEGWDDIPLADILRENFSLPVFVDTSVRCMALAEQRYGAGIGTADQVFVSLGNNGIASALIIDSKLCRGGSGYAGEIGHVMSSDKGQRCTCGNYDCLELSATLMMIIERIAAEIKDSKAFSPLLRLLPSDWKKNDITPSLIRQAIDEGDKICYEIIETAGRHTGIALANLLNVLNPSLVILGGSVVEFFPIIIDTIRNTIRERVLVPIQQNLEVKPAQLDWRGAVSGSAIMALSEFFAVTD